MYLASEAQRDSPLSWTQGIKTMKTGDIGQLRLMSVEHIVSCSLLLSYFAKAYSSGEFSFELLDLLEVALGLV